MTRITQKSQESQAERAVAWQYKRSDGDPSGPLTHNVPEGPPAAPLTGPEEGRAAAEAAATADIGSGAYDAIGLAHDGPLLFEHGDDARFCQSEAQAHQRKIGDLVMGEAIQGRTDAEHAALKARLDPVVEELERAQRLADDCTLELSGAEPYQQSIWKAPERLTESARQTFVKTWGTFAVLLPIEFSVNVLALKLLGNTASERWAFALVMGTASVWAGHTAGRWIRDHRDAPRIARWSLPAVLTLLVVALVAFVTGLRVAYVDQPGEPDPLTGQPGPRLLEDAHIPSWVVLAGIGAIQLIFFIITVQHSADAHNPRVVALQRARSTVAKLRRKNAKLILQQRIAANTDSLARGHAARTEQLWDAYIQELRARSAERLGIYLSTAARTLGDPEATVALEARAGRSAKLRAPEPVAAPAPAVPAGDQPAGAQDPIALIVPGPTPETTEPEGTEPEGTEPPPVMPLDRQGRRSPTEAAADEAREEDEGSRPPAA